MRIKVKAVFDIGKTNKKFFLFDENFKEVYKVYAEFEEILDDDGHPSEDIRNLKKWALAVFDKALDDDHFEIESLNFSTYGASFVHIGESGEVVGSLYNYTKKYDEALARRFYERYGPMEDFCQQTASSNLGWLNSGLQLYWIKHLKSDLHQKIKYSLHLPQYLSYIFTGDFFSEYTSIGCHTGLWDYEKKDYHKWVYEEGIDHQLPEIVPTSTKVIKSFKGRQMTAQRH
jgi:sugar (pentulose or hexulose) kinase